MALAATTHDSALLIVNGLPATGKTSLARAIGGALGWPVLHKDDYKEVLFDALGFGTRERSRELGVATLALLYHTADVILAARGALILECNFHPAAAAPRLRAMLSQHGSRAAQVFCHCDPTLRFERFYGRSRHPGHVDQPPNNTEKAAFLADVLEPVGLDAPLLRVDTGLPPDLRGVIAWVNRTLLTE